MVEFKDKKVLIAFTVYEYLSIMLGETVSELAQNGEKLFNVLKKILNF